MGNEERVVKPSSSITHRSSPGILTACYYAPIRTAEIPNVAMKPLTLALAAACAVAAIGATHAQTYPTKPVRLVVPFALGGLDASSEQGSRLRDATVRESAAAAVLIAQASIPREQYPHRPIRMIVPFAPGGGADITGRAIAQKLAEGLGQQVVVDNRPGAAGNIGTELAARSAPDGYTLLLIGPNHTTNVSLFAKLNYDPVRDFEPISLVTSAPYVLLVHPSLPARNVKELIALARAKPGQLTYGSSGNGTAGHLAMELVKTQAKIDMVHVPYKGSQPLLTDLIGGQIVTGFGDALSSTPQVQAGRLRALAVSGARRARTLPDVPTVAEAALPGFDVTVWQGILAPAGTPREIVARLHSEIVNALQKPEVQSRMAALGVDIIGNSPQEFAAFIKRDIAKWAVVIKASGARID